MTTYLALGISAAALLISFYGILERRRAAYSGLRVRLTELLETIEELNVSEGRYAEEAAADADPERPPMAGYAFAGKRALLTYQALDLVERLTSSRYARVDRITASEYGSLAYSLDSCGDVDGARRHWERAIACADHSYVPPVVHAANLRGLGSTLMQRHELDAARRSFETAASVEMGPTPTDLAHVFHTYLQWLSLEKGLGDDSSPELPARAAHAAVGTSGPWVPEYLWQLSEAVKTTIVVQPTGQYREVTLDDLLRFSIKELVNGASLPDSQSSDQAP